MEEKRLVERFSDVFAKAVPILENVRKGFLGEDVDAIAEGRKSFRELLLSRVAFVQEMIDKKDKTEAQKLYVMLLPSVMSVALAIENLISKMETKVEAKIVFSEQGVSEVAELFTVMEGQLRDTRDYLITKNPVLKASIEAAWQKIFSSVNEYGLVHQDRLVTGACMPQASYLYLDMVDSVKRISRGLVDILERV